MAEKSGQERAAERTGPGAWVDLHIHSTASDGTFSPDEVVREAAGLGIRVLALTDHDTVAGVETAVRTARELGLRMIPGVELSAEGNLPLHILGYFVDVHRTVLTDMLVKMQEARVSRAAQMIDNLRRLGLDIGMEDVGRYAASGVIARPHMARALVEKGYAVSIKEAFDRYLGTGRPAYVPKARLSAGEAIGIIRSAGGSAVLAHPRFVKLPRDKMESLIAGLKDEGLRGMECYYPHNPPGFTQWCLEMCRKYALVSTGGSDFHGDNRPDQPIGTAQSGVCYPPDYPECLMADGEK